jgi:hypothetical protein
MYSHVHNFSVSMLLRRFSHSVISDEVIPEIISPDLDQIVCHFEGTQERIRTIAKCKIRNAVILNFCALFKSKHAKQWVPRAKTNRFRNYFRTIVRVLYSDR